MSALPAHRTVGPAPYELLDDGFVPEPCELLVLGCGNILRGDDAVGPVLVRTLLDEGVPAGVRVVDGGTAGMDVAFGMRGASRVVVVDACRSGGEPGTVFRLPAEVVAELPPVEGLHLHNFRWDHALAFSSWLLGPGRPTDVTVYLVEAGSFEPGAPLTEPVAEGMRRVAALLRADHFPADAEVTLDDAGYLRLPAELAAQRFPADVCVARREGDELRLFPLQDAAHGGLVLKQCNVRGDRSLLLHEVLGFAPVGGRFPAFWDDAAGALKVRLEEATTGGDRGADRGDPRARPVVGLPAGDHAGGGRPETAEDLLHAATGAADGGRRPADRGAAADLAGRGR
ncbi:hydrogenase maturation protease [uncultured Nocardioides sp.]|uniref:hydrogenase maturation protease n=1 Tax=uncultured Nocardioides sp. TaxID=198441 RepID=UPI00260B1D9B|nr:hydrogenase maturation protease [uncultured Nocardioides sp.]